MRNGNGRKSEERLNPIPRRIETKGVFLLIDKSLSQISDHWYGLLQACILLSPPPVGVGEIKGSGDEEGNQRGKKRKKGNLGKI